MAAFLLFFVKFLVDKIFFLPCPRYLYKFKIGCVLTAEGSVYRTKAKAIEGNATPIAMIAYADNGSGFPAPYNHGMAIALDDETQRLNYSNSVAAAKAKTVPTISPYSAQWCIPNVHQWCLMMQEMGGSPSNFGGFSEALKHAGGTGFKTSWINASTEHYWSSSLIKATGNSKIYNCFLFEPDYTYWSSYIGFAATNTMNTRAALAF